MSGAEKRGWRASAALRRLACGQYVPSVSWQRVLRAGGGGEMSDAWRAMREEHLGENLPFESALHVNLYCRCLAESGFLRRPTDLIAVPFLPVSIVHYSRPDGGGVECERRDESLSHKVVVFLGFYKEVTSGAYRAAVFKFNADNMARTCLQDLPPTEVFFGRVASDIGVGPTVYASAYRLHRRHAFQGVLQEYVGNDTSALRERGLSIAQNFRVAQQVASHLKAFKALGYTHGDVKMENVCVQLRGDSTVEVRLIDFGMARALRISPAECRGFFCQVPDKHQYTGTYQVNPPEKRCAASMKCDCRISASQELSWWLGVLLWDLFCSELPVPFLLHPCQIGDLSAYRLYVNAAESIFSSTALLVRCMSLVPQLAHPDGKKRMSIERASQLLDEAQHLLEHDAFVFVDTQTCEKMFLGNLDSRTSECPQVDYDPRAFNRSHELIHQASRSVYGAED